MERSKETAIRQLMRDLGVGEQKAIEIYNRFAGYFGESIDGQSIYSLYTSGQMPRDTKKMSNALLRMPYYNGPIYRGMHFESEEAFKGFVEKIKVGKIFTFTDTLDIGDKIVTSWSSSEESARMYLKEYSKKTKGSILFKMADNKTAAGVRHLSKFGDMENEVLSPAGHRMMPVKIVETKDSFGRPVLEIYVSDKGWRKPSEWD